MLIDVAIGFGWREQIVKDLQNQSSSKDKALDFFKHEGEKEEEYVIAITDVFKNIRKRNEEKTNYINSLCN